MEKIRELWKSDLNKFRIVTLLAFTAIILAMAWQSDDAYHGYVMAKHLVEGHGFVYNIGERATASSCPLFTLIIALGYLLTGSMFLTSIVISVLLSAGAYYILCRYFCKSVKQVMLCFLALCGSFTFISYTTSGLENCLLFFLYALFMKIYLDSETYDGRQLTLLALLVSAIALARMDAALIAAPMAVYAFLFKRREASFFKGVLLGILGLLPFVLWLMYSLFYYGFPFPNTAYVKLGTGIPQREYYARGLLYYFVTAINDLLVVLLPFGFCVASFAIKKAKYIVTALGIALYGFYILHIGGDFMAGRHFTVIFLISVMGFMAMENRELGAVKNGEFVGKAFTAMVIGGLVFAVTIPSAVGNQYLYGHEKAWPIADERRNYFPHTSLFNNLGQDMEEGAVIRGAWNEAGIDELRQLNLNGGILPFVPGISIYYNSDLYLNDRYALGDPFLSKLPAVREENWRVGHVYREIPAGYNETVQSGVNVIENEDLREYYDKIYLITHGNLWDRERIETIIRMNLGEYDYLIENYRQKLGY